MKVKIITEENAHLQMIKDSKCTEIVIDNELEVCYESKEEHDTEEDKIIIYADTVENPGNDLLTIAFTRKEAYLLAKTLLTMLECHTE